VFILNVGHVAEEIDCEYLRQFRHEEVMPYINAYRMGDKTVYLMANGSMLNLTAGFGDSLNAFDVTLAVMASGIQHIVTDGMTAPADVSCRRAYGKKRCKHVRCHFPEAARCACPGYRPADSGGLVARSAQRHREESNAYSRASRNMTSPSSIAAPNVSPVCPPEYASAPDPAPKPAPA
jgi:hypothetical protein